MTSAIAMALLHPDLLCVCPNIQRSNASVFASTNIDFLKHRFQTG
jgi:hypothetical protein